MYLFYEYKGSIDNWGYYVRYYKENKIRKSLFDRYVANSLGAIARAEKSYDEVIESFEDRLYNRKKRTGADIKKDLMKKFNKESE